MRVTLNVVASVVSLVMTVCGAVAPAGAQVLYWLDTRYAAPTITRADANGVTLTSVALAAGALPEGLAIGPGGTVYWAEAAWSGASVQRAGALLTGITPIITGGSAFRGVAVDEVAQLVYWTSSNIALGSAVHRAGLDGSDATTIVALSPGSNPRGIAVDHAGGKIYWADMEQSTIYRANLDGSGAAPWLGTGYGPYGLAIDAAGQRIYWTEYGTGRLGRANLDGSGSTPLITGLANPTYLALDVPGSRMYWAEGGVGAQKIRRANTDGAGMVTLPSPLATYGGLAYQTNSVVSVPDDVTPTELVLHTLRSNPGTGPFEVRFSLPRETRLRLSVLDLMGREIAVLADGVMPAGHHERTWSAGASRAAAAGIYFVRLAAAGETRVQRLALIP